MMSADSKSKSHAAEFGEVVGPGAVKFERLLPGPIERVWEYLTDSEKRGKWLASGTMDLRVGGRVELKFLHADLSAEKQIPDKYKMMECGHLSHGKITQLDPPRLLSYTWSEDPNDPSEVTFELTPRDKQVLLVLTHRRLADRNTMVEVAGGWHSHLVVLEDRLYGRDPQVFWSNIVRLGPEYESRIPE